MNIGKAILLRVFVIIGTGFIGKVLIEKMLRVTEIEKIYLLIRKKRGESPRERLRLMIKDPVSEKIKTKLFNHPPLFHANKLQKFSFNL